VDPSCVGEEGGGYAEGGEDEEERDPEHEYPEGEAGGSVRPDPPTCLPCARAQLYRSCLPVVFSVEEPFFSEAASFVLESPFLVVSVFCEPALL
jgi:hypothetical protein